MLFLGVICIEHLVFCRIFQLINSSNKPIPVYSYQYNQYDMYTNVHVTCLTRHYMRNLFSAGLVWNMNINSYKATEMIMEALNTFLLTATIIK